MFSLTSSSSDSVFKMQMAQKGWKERHIKQSCTFSTVAEVLRLYLLCPCQPLLRRDCFDKRAQRGFMCLFQSYCQCKHCWPCIDTKEAHRKTVRKKKVVILWAMARWFSGENLWCKNKKGLNGPLSKPNHSLSKFNSDHFCVFDICPSSDWKWVNVVFVCLLVWLPMFLCWTIINRKTKLKVLRYQKWTKSSQWDLNWLAGLKVQHYSIVTSFQLSDLTDVERQVKAVYQNTSSLLRTHTPTKTSVQC